jgi:hypothetical protein
MESVALLELAKKAAEVVIPEAMRGFLDKRRRAAFDILVEELRTAKVSPDEAAERDDVVGMMVKFYTAMAQGAAFSNLRVMAKILAGKAADASQRSDDFVMWADSIGGMLPDEVRVLATLTRFYQAELGRNTEREGSTIDRAMSATRDELVGEGKFFSDAVEFRGALSALLRTGLVLPVSAWGDLAYEPSPRALRLARLVALDGWADDTIQRGCERHAHAPLTPSFRDAGDDSLQH